jgi:hypothetical protein
MLLIAMVSRDILVACGSLIGGNPRCSKFAQSGCLSGGHDSASSLMFNIAFSLFTVETPFSPQKLESLWRFNTI